jgi:purine nucleosidase
MARLLWLFALIFLVAVPAQSAERRKVIIDDDGFGLMQMMLLADPDVDVLGITTVSGDSWANRVTALALRGLEIMHRSDVPVVPGATYPLVNSEALTDRWEGLYGKLVWKGAWMKQWVEPTAQSTPAYHGPNDPVDLPAGNPTTRPSAEIAANFLIRMVHAHPGEISIIVCGPMTNLALAQRLDPSFAGLAKELVYMGGSFNPHQRLDTPSAAQFAREFANAPRREFNMRFDPEAASIVSRSAWRRIVVVPVDPSTGTERTRGLLERMAAVSEPGVAGVIAKMEPGFPLWDEIVAGVWLDPTLATDTASLFVDYDTQFGPTYGDTLSWDGPYRPQLGEQPAQVVRAIDAHRLEALMVRLMAETKRARQP